MKKQRAAMASELVRCFCILLLFLLQIIIPCSQAKSSCKPYGNVGPDAGEGSIESRRFKLGEGNNTFDIITESGTSRDIPRDKLLQMPKDSQALVYISRPFFLYYPSIPRAEPDYRFFRDTEASFSVSFSMSAYHPSQARRGSNGGLVFLVIPSIRRVDHPDKTTIGDVFAADGPIALSHPIARSVGNVSVQIGTARLETSEYFDYIDAADTRIHAVKITMEDDPDEPSNYTVWVDHDGRSHFLSVYVERGDGRTTKKPASPIACLRNVILVDDVHYAAEFALFCSLGQFLQVHTWSVWVEDDSSCYWQQRDAQWKRFWILFYFKRAAGLVLLFAGVGVAAWYYLRSKHRKWKKEQQKLTKAMQRLPGVPTQVEFADVKNATANFHERMKLGRGGFSSVYRCRLPAAASRTGQAMEVAVKKFTREVQERRYEDFVAEVSIINRLRHKNIVPLVGWSYHKGVPLLIYDYMTNGSLDQHLFRKGASTGQQQHKEDSTRAIRQWHTRYSIVKDVATGLHYVHHEHEPMVLHRDIKASNIMLDSNFNGRLGDFGIASTVSADRSSVTGVFGTWGYIAPEYAMSQRATRQTDIYAFGVLVLEVVTGRRWDFQLQPDDDHITDWVWRLHGEGRLLEAVAQEIQDADADAERLLLLGLACTNPNPSSRPSMAEAVQVITKLAPPPEVPPAKPTFVWPPEDWRSVLDTDCTTTMSNLDRSWGSTVELVEVGLEERQPAVSSFSTTSM